jgi:hypothetical protein
MYDMLYVNMHTCFPVTIYMRVVSMLRILYGWQGIDMEIVLTKLVDDRGDRKPGTSCRVGNAKRRWT